MCSYILSVDQSTQGTKGLLFDGNGKVLARAHRQHRQMIDHRGWVEHDPKEILRNTILVCRDVIEKAGIPSEKIRAMGISNQRETAAAWNRDTGEPICNAIVWQCARAREICETHKEEGEEIRLKTGLRLSPYFPAAKFEWIMRYVPEGEKLAEQGKLALGTIDSWLVYSLSQEKNFKTDYSNASRTQLFHLKELCWDRELCRSFGIPENALPEVSMSDSCFGFTDLAGVLKKKIPIMGVIGDSHGALFGQNCLQKGQLKATYGTGSSVMMNLGDQPVMTDSGIVTSLAWGRKQKVQYVLEGNLNYTGAVVRWMKEVGLIQRERESGELAAKANRQDRTYFIPAFTGLGAPYWDADATGLMTGITRTTGRNEMVKACLESIAYQITDLIDLMRQESGDEIRELRVDGGPTANAYLMQFQSDLSEAVLRIPELEELSAMGAAYLAGISAGIYDEKGIFEHISYREYHPQMGRERVNILKTGWREAIGQVLAHGGKQEGVYGA